MKRILKDPPKPVNKTLTRQFKHVEAGIGIIAPDNWMHFIFPTANPTTLFILRFVSKGAYNLVHQFLFLTPGLYKLMFDVHTRNTEIAKCGSVTLYDWFTAILFPDKIEWVWTYFIKTAKQGHLELVKHSRGHMSKDISPLLEIINNHDRVVGNYSIPLCCLQLKKVIRHGNMELLNEMIPIFKNTLYINFHLFVGHYLGKPQYIRTIFKAALQSENMEMIKFLGEPFITDYFDQMENEIILLSKTVEFLESVFKLFNVTWSDSPTKLISAALDNPNPKILKWALQKSKKNLDFVYFSHIARFAIRSNNAKYTRIIFKFLARHSPDDALDNQSYQTCIIDAIAYETYEILKWLLSDGLNFTEAKYEDVVNFIKKGKLDQTLLKSVKTVNGAKTLTILMEHKIVQHDEARYFFTDKYKSTSDWKRLDLIQYLFEHDLMVLLPDAIPNIILMDEVEKLEMIINLDRGRFKEKAQHWFSFAVDDVSNTLYLISRLGKEKCESACIKLIKQMFPNVQ